MTRLLGIQSKEIEERARCEACSFLCPESSTEKNPDYFGSFLVWFVLIHALTEIQERSI